MTCRRRVMEPYFWKCGRFEGRGFWSLRLCCAEERIGWGWRGKSNRRRKQLRGGRWSYTVNHVVVMRYMGVVGEHTVWGRGRGGRRVEVRRELWAVGFGGRQAVILITTYHIGFNGNKSYGGPPGLEILQSCNSAGLEKRPSQLRHSRYRILVRIGIGIDVGIGTYGDGALRFVLVLYIGHVPQPVSQYALLAGLHRASVPVRRTVCNG